MHNLEKMVFKLWLPPLHNVTSLQSCLHESPNKDSLCSVADPWWMSTSGFCNMLPLHPYTLDRKHLLLDMWPDTWWPSRSQEEIRLVSLEKPARGNRSSGLGKGFCHGRCWCENKYFSIHPNNLEKGEACFKYCNISVGSRRWFRFKCWGEKRPRDLVFNHQACVWRAQIVTRASRFSGLLSCLLEIWRKEPDGGWAVCGLHYYRESPFTNCNQLKMEGIIIVGNCPEQSDHPHSEGKLEISCSVFSISELTTRKT